MEGTLKAARPSRIQPTEPCSGHWPGLISLSIASSLRSGSFWFQPPPLRVRPWLGSARKWRRRQVAPARAPVANGQRPGHAGGVPLATARGWRGGGGRRRHVFLFIVPQIADLGRGTAPRRAAARSARLSVISGLFCWVGRLGATGPGLCQVRDFSTSYVGLFPVAFRSRVS